MYKHIYDCFKHWYNEDRGGIWFYSDPHFDDQEMMYLRKNYIGDEEQIARINSKLGKHDTLVILGDIGKKEYLSKIKGHKILILGNHDTGATTYEDYADEVYEGPLFINDKILLSHEPINYRFGLNIHGHDHSNWSYDDIYHINVCAEKIDYTPISLKSIINEGRLKNVDNIHRATINKATKTKFDKRPFFWYNIYKDEDKE